MIRCYLLHDARRRDRPAGLGSAREDTRGSLVQSRNVFKRGSIALAKTASSHICPAPGAPGAPPRPAPCRYTSPFRYVTRMSNYLPDSIITPFIVFWYIGRTSLVLNQVEQHSALLCASLSTTPQMFLYWRCLSLVIYSSIVYNSFLSW